jgi:ABC-type Na+ efflux pump permease subunit
MEIPSSPITEAHAFALSTSRRSNPLATVLRWELRRLGAARSTWIIVLVIFILTCLVQLVFTNADQRTIQAAFGPRTFWIDWGSNFGLLHTLPEIFGMGLALFTPFLCTDGVARDLKRRTHELLMTTALPSWAYVWGRYLSILLLSLALACLMLLALVFVTLLKHQIQPDLYLEPDLHGMIVLWAIIALPPAIILGSISFALGTVWPRYSTLIKIALVSGWFLIPLLIGQLNLGNAFAIWDPTSQTAALAQVDTGDVLQQLTLQTRTQNTQLFLVTWHALEQHLPDMHMWIVPRLIWCGVGIVCVILAVLFFRRFRNAVG